MKRITKTLPIITAAVIVSFVATTRYVIAEDASQFEAADQFISDKLDNIAELSEDQRTKMHTLLHEQLPVLKILVTKYKEELRTLHETIGNATADEKAIRTEASKLADVLVDYAKQRTQLAKTLQDVLTPEQRDKAQQGQRDVQTILAKFVNEVTMRLAKD